MFGNRKKLEGTLREMLNTATKPHRLVNTALGSSLNLRLFLVTLIRLCFGEFFVGQLRSADHHFIVVVLGDHHEFHAGSADETWNWHVHPHCMPDACAAIGQGFKMHCFRESMFAILQ